MNYAPFSMTGHRTSYLIEEMGKDDLSVLGDREHVALCLSQGGFPRGLSFEGKQAYIGPDNKVWVYKP